jgi:hypothetical protein
MTADEVRCRNEDAPRSSPDLFEFQSSVARGDLVVETAALPSAARARCRKSKSFVPMTFRAASGGPKEPATDEGVELAYRDAVIDDESRGHVPLPLSGRTRTGIIHPNLHFLRNTRVRARAKPMGILLAGRGF